jgi:ABC-type cobalt transport system substrate-binding protein
MSRKVLGAGLVVALATGALLGMAQGASWPGVDETVVEKFAEAAGRPPRPPLLDLGEGDVQLFLFLVAGAVGGFVAGYFFRELFPPKGKREDAPR